MQRKTESREIWLSKECKRSSPPIFPAILSYNFGQQEPVDSAFFRGRRPALFLRSFHSALYLLISKSICPRAAPMPSARGNVFCIAISAAQSSLNRFLFSYRNHFISTGHLDIPIHRPLIARVSELFIRPRRGTVFRGPLLPSSSSFRGREHARV